MSITQIEAEQLRNMNDKENKMILFAIRLRQP